MHILVTRPETEAPRTTRQLEAMGHRVTAAPLLDVVVETPALDLQDVQALVLTSRNAVHALDRHPQRMALTAIPVLAVGKSTATAAREAGFQVALHGDAGGAELADLVLRNRAMFRGTLLHLAGEAVAFDLEHALAPQGLVIRRAIVYQTRPIASLPPHVWNALDAGDLEAVLLMSPRTATAWCELVKSAGLGEKAARLVHLCLSEGVADAARGLAPTHIEIAAKPNEQEMLALATRLASSSARRS